MYTCFAFACLWGYRKQFTTQGKAYQKRALLLTLVISIAYGGLTELMQEFIVPNRTGDWKDFLADSLGTLLGVAIFYLFYRKKNKIHPNCVS